VPGPVTGLVLLAGVLAAILATIGGFVIRRPRAAGGSAEQVGEELARARLARFVRRRLDPEAATGLALTVALGLVFAAALGFGLVADMVTSETGLYRYDASAAAWGAENATATSTRLLGLVTWLGSTVVVLALTVLLGGLEWLRRRRLTVLAFMVTVVVGQNLIANGVKLLVERERPPVAHLAASSGFSFPSGHSAAAAATSAAVVLVLGRGRPRRVKVLLAAAAALVAVAVAASRVLLGVHWLTDVVGGAALGFGWFVVCSVAFGGALLRFAAPAERVQAAEDRGDEEPGPGSRLAGVHPRPTGGAEPMPDHEPSAEQVDSRAGTLAAEPGNSTDDTQAQARALLEESEERVEDPAVRDPDDRGVIRRRSDEGVAGE
jgi:membrane-associated phospholipid phosphatase